MEVKWDEKLTETRGDAQAAIAESEKRGQTWDVRNLTAEPIELTGPGQPRHVVPAFGSRRLDRDPYITFDKVDELAAGNELEITENMISGSQTAQLIVLGLAFWVVPPFVAVALIWGDRSWWLIVGLAALGLAVVLIAWRRKEIVREALQRAPRRAMNLLSLLLVLVFAVVVPAVTIYLGADLHDVVERAATEPLTDGGTDDLTLIARGLQLLFIAAASMLPGLLYFQFDRERLGTIWEKFTRQVFRLDRRVTTEAALMARYGFLMEEVFGRARPDRRGRLLPGKLSPIVVATLIFVLGWLLTLLNPQIGAITDQTDLVSLFQPHHSAVTFAFLGAYVYALGALLRGYVRRDLRPKSYTDITVRILTVVALAWLLQVFFPDEAPALLVFAFATGLVPQIAFTLLREAMQGGRLEERWKRLWAIEAKAQPAGGGSGARDESPDHLAVPPDNLPAPELGDPLPLTQLEGIDLYDRARLASEGITNIEALAHSDLIELLVQTRIPAPRLIDWVDQAILYLHVPNREDDRSSYEVLRGVGIRNATDLLRASEKAKARAREQSDKDAKDNGANADDLDGNAFLQMLGNVGAGGPKRLSIIIDAIEDEEWLDKLLYWRLQGAPNDATLQALAGSPAGPSATGHIGQELVRSVTVETTAQSRRPQGVPMADENLNRYCIVMSGAEQDANDKAALLDEARWQTGDEIRVKFLESDEALQERVRAVAERWTAPGMANLTFQFVSEGDAEIRIAFQQGNGSWSYLGTQCRDIPDGQPTMNYGWLTAGSSDDEIQSVVLHEFGHALGLIHEHQNPEGGIDWNEPAVIADLEGPPNNWDEPKIRHNVLDHYSKDAVTATSVDRLSIMMYPIPAAWTNDGFSAGLNDDLSETDIEFVRSAYADGQSA